jgi:hypothetical protein
MGQERYLHEMAFYNRIIDIEVLKNEVEKVKRYIADIEELMKH